MCMMLLMMNSKIIFKGPITLVQIKQTPEELVSFVYREAFFSAGCLIMTCTGIVPDRNFTLQSADEI